MASTRLENVDRAAGVADIGVVDRAQLDMRAGAFTQGLDVGQKGSADWPSLEKILFMGTFLLSRCRMTKSGG